MSNESREDRREFLKAAAAGVTGVVMGGTISPSLSEAAAGAGPAPLNTSIKNLLGATSVYYDLLSTHAKKLTKKDLIHLRKMHLGQSDAIETVKLKTLTFSDVKSIENAFDQKAQGENGFSTSALKREVQADDTSYCCCCSPCCTCAAAVTRPSRRLT